MSKWRTVLGAGLVWLLAAGAGSAQEVAGSQVSGVVRDSSGGVLPGVEVTLTKTDTGTSRTVFTGADGTYVFPNLPVGPYRLRVSLQGFTTYVRDGIVLQVNSNPTIDVTLAVGNIGEQVTVTAAASTVETRSTGVGQVIDNQRVTEIPLNGRQATELIFLSGLATSAPAGDLNTNKNYPTVTISVAGGQANGMTYIMDGGTHNDPFNNLNLPTPFPDALQEFKVETSSLPARYGHHAASAVNLVTKSGTNSLQRQRVRLRARLSLQRAQLLRADARQPEAQPVRRNARRPGRQGQAVLLWRLPGPDREEQSAGDGQLRAHGGHAGGRLHRHRRAGVQRTADHAVAGGRLRQQHHQPVGLQPGRDEVPAARPRVDGPLRPTSIRDSERQHRASDRSDGPTTRSRPITGSLAATCTPSTTIRRPTTEPTC